MPHSSSWKWSSHPPQLMWCWMKRTAVSSVMNQDILHDIALTLGAMIAMSMVTLSWTVHTEYLLQELQWHTTNHTKITMPDQVWGTTVKVETGEANPDHSPAFEDIAAQGIVICIETTLDCNTRIDAATTGAAHDDLPQPTEDTATDLAVTHCTSHIADHPNIEVLQVINPEIAVGLIHDHPTDLQGMNCVDQVDTPAGQEEGHIPRRTWRWRLKIHTQIITAPMITPVTWDRNQIL